MEEFWQIPRYRNATPARLLRTLCQDSQFIVFCEVMKPSRLQGRDICIVCLYSFFHGPEIWARLAPLAPALTEDSSGRDDWSLYLTRPCAGRGAVSSEDKEEAYGVTIYCRTEESYVLSPKCMYTLLMLMAETNTVRRCNDPIRSHSTSLRYPCAHLRC